MSRTTDRPQPLKSERVQIALMDLPGWRALEESTAIATEYRFGGVAGSLGFLRRLAKEALTAEVNPSFSHSGDFEVQVVLATPSLNGVTDRDIAFAHRLEGLPKEGLAEKGLADERPAAS